MHPSSQILLMTRQMELRRRGKLSPRLSLLQGVDGVLEAMSSPGRLYILASPAPVSSLHSHNSFTQVPPCSLAILVTSGEDRPFLQLSLQENIFVMPQVHELVVEKQRPRGLGQCAQAWSGFPFQPRQAVVTPDPGCLRLNPALPLPCSVMLGKLLTFSVADEYNVDTRVPVS